MVHSENRARQKRVLRKLQRKAEQEVIDHLKAEVTHEERLLIHAILSNPEYQRFSDAPDSTEYEANLNAFLTTLPADQQALHKKFEARTEQLLKEHGVPSD